MTQRISASILDLGEQPLPAEYGLRREKEVLDRFPLHLKICRDCGLGQLGEYVLPDRIFHDNYPYLSSTSDYWVSHAQQFAREMTDKLSLDSDSLVIELGSNDGYLLSQFKRLKVSVLVANHQRILHKLLGRQESLPYPNFLEPN